MTGLREGAARSALGEANEHHLTNNHMVEKWSRMLVIQATMEQCISLIDMHIEDLGDADE